MKRSFSLRGITAALALVAISATSPLYAQSDYSARPGSSHLTIGPGVALGASMALDAMEGSKIKPIFAYHAGVDATYPLSPNIASTLSLGIESRGTQIHPHNASQAYQNTRISYFHLTPGFTFSSFYIGLNVALPTGGSIETSETSTDMTEAAEDKLETLIEPRVGVIIPIMDSIIGWMGITLTGGISLDEYIDRGERSDDQDSDAYGNFQNASLYLGTTFQFAIPGTGRR